MPLLSMVETSMSNATMSAASRDGKTLREIDSETLRRRALVVTVVEVVEDDVTRPK